MKFDNFEKHMKQMKSPSLEELKAEGDAAYEKAVAEERKLLDAYDRKALKSKDAIRRAKALKKEQAKAEAAKVAK